MNWWGDGDDVLAAWGEYGDQAFPTIVVLVRSSAGQLRLERITPDQQSTALRLLAPSGHMVVQQVTNAVRAGLGGRSGPFYALVP